MKIINDTTVVVSTSDELKRVLEETNYYSYIYLDGIITTTSPIHIHIVPSKLEITIDGTYNGLRGKLIDEKSQTKEDAIAIFLASNIHITVKNIDIVGSNDNGMIYILEQDTTRNVITEFDNITYEGPKLVSNYYGLVKISNSEITIKDATAQAKEVASCSHLMLSGATTIIHNSVSSSVFMFQDFKDPHFIVEQEANITISTSVDLFAGAYGLDFTFRNDSIFNLTTVLGVSHNDYSGRIILINARAIVNITQTGTNKLFPTWSCSRLFDIYEDASVSIICEAQDSTDKNPVIYFTKKPTYFVLNSPKKAIFYNKNADAVATAVTTIFNFSVKQINFWKNAKPVKDAGNIDDIPDYSWYHVSIPVGWLAVAGSFTTSSTSFSADNFTAEDLAQLPSLSNFSFYGTPVISVGIDQLLISYLKDINMSCSGYTEPFTDVLTTLNDSLAIKGVSDNDGHFITHFGVAFQDGDKVKYVACKQNSFIYNMRKIKVPFGGEVGVLKPIGLLSYSLNFAQLNPLLLARNEEVRIITKDLREAPKEYTVYIKSQNGIANPFDIVYKNGMNISLVSNNDMEVFKSSNISDQILWSKTEGVLIKVMDGRIIDLDKKYVASLDWSIK